MGFESVVPEGWSEERPGEFKRGASDDDPTALIQVGIRGFTVDALVEMLLPSWAYRRCRNATANWRASA